MKNTRRSKRKNWSKKAKSVGDSNEYLCRDDLRRRGFFAIRLCHSQQVGSMSKVDVIFFHPHYGGLVQCKRRKKYMTNEDKLLLKDTAMNNNTMALLMWRDRGAKYETLHSSIDSKISVN